MPFTALQPYGVMGQTRTFSPKDPGVGPGITILNYERGVLTGNSRGIHRGTCMIIQHQKGSARYLSFPMISTAAPETFLTGLSVVDTGYYKDGAGAWTALAIADSVTEIGSTGMYEIDLSGTEMNHDQIMIKFTASGAADVAVVIDTRTLLAEDLNNFDSTTDQVTVATNNDKTGYSISGTLTTLDALDTAQDSQHATTQSLISGLNDLDASGVAAAVWNAVSSSYVTAGTFGAFLDVSVSSRSSFDEAVDQVIVGTNNDKTGYSISGTITTLDALDTEQDTQHATTQSLVSGLNDPDADSIADAVLTRNLSNVEVGMAEHTLGTICLMGLESVASGGTLTIYRTDGITTHVTKTLTSDPAADPVVGVS